MPEMRLASVRQDIASGTPVVLLQELTGRRALPIYIGTVEAQAMLQALRGFESPRPLTYELFIASLEEAGARIDRIVITDLVERTFYAELHLIVAGERRVVSARPSDAVNLALRAGCPIFCDDDLMASEGVEIEEEDEEALLIADDDRQEDPEVLVSEFNKFIEGLRPEDFT